MNNTINEIRSFAGNTIFTAITITKDGKQRKFICRLNVKKYLSGGTMPYNAEERNLLPVFDMKIKQYRIINLNTLRYLRIRKKVLFNSTSN